MSNRCSFQAILEDAVSVSDSVTLDGKVFRMRSAAVISIVDRTW